MASFSCQPGSINEIIWHSSRPRRSMPLSMTRAAADPFPDPFQSHLAHDAKNKGDTVANKFED